MTIPRHENDTTRAQQLAVEYAEDSAANSVDICNAVVLARQSSSAAPCGSE